MNTGLDAIAAALDALRVAGGEQEPSAMSPGGLVAANAAFGMLRRQVEAAHARVAAEIARQSRPELGRESLAKKHGFRTPAQLISTVTGTTVGDAARLVAVAEATAPRLTLSGETAPAKHPHVAAAFAAGRIGKDAATAIIGMLDRVAVRADRNALIAMEQTLAEQAVGLGLDHLAKLILRAEAHLDPDGVAPREEVLRKDRTLAVRKDRSGAIVITAKYDPENGAPIVAAIDGLVGGMMARRDHAVDSDREDAESAEGSTAEMADRRTVAQMRADALTELCRHALGCDEVPTLASTTVVVRIDLADLEAGVGTATIDGIDAPVTAATARRMAADAQIIPCVLGGDSEILDWGRAKRLFTPAQKLALTERDGGCSFCGLPPSMAVGHHLLWWARDRGKTDLQNGILLCTACHHRIHDDGWDIRIDGPGTKAKVWFIPPPWLDPDRTPRLGGRARYDLTA